MKNENEDLKYKTSLLASERKEKIAILKQKNFDFYKHKLPRFNIYGYQIAEFNKPNQDNFNILKEYSQSEKHFQLIENPQIKTQSLLKENRRKEMIPDSSYDLDGYLIR